VKKVPNTSGQGVGRRSYQKAYAKTASSKTSDVLEGRKLSSPKIPGVEGKADYRKESVKSSTFNSTDYNVDFHHTGRDTLPGWSK